MVTYLPPLKNLAAISGLMKDFFDRTYYGVLDHVHGRPYAALVCAGSDGSNAARQINRIATGWRLQPVAEPLVICTHAQTPAAIAAPKQISPQTWRNAARLGMRWPAGWHWVFSKTIATSAYCISTSSRFYT